MAAYTKWLVSNLQYITWPAAAYNMHTTDQYTCNSLTRINILLGHD